jgi:hypothetical protein
MMSALFGLTGTVPVGAGTKPFRLTIMNPEKDNESGDYRCRVSAPEISLKLDCFGLTKFDAIRDALLIASERVASAFMGQK